MKSDEAIELIKFYEEAAGRIKERTWTIAAWVLSLSSGLIAFCYSLENDKHYLFKQEFTIKAACLAGIGLCFALGALLLSQREHLREYYRLQVKLSNVDEGTKTLFQFANAVVFARTISGAVIARGASLPRCTRPFVPSNVSIVEKIPTCSSLR